MQWIEYNEFSEIISYQKYFFFIQEGLLSRDVCIIPFVYLLVVILIKIYKSNDLTVTSKLCPNN